MLNVHYHYDPGSGRDRRSATNGRKPATFHQKRRSTAEKHECFVIIQKRDARSHNYSAANYLRQLASQFKSCQSTRLSVSARIRNTEPAARDIETAIIIHSPDEAAFNSLISRSSCSIRSRASFNCSVSRFSFDA